MKIITVKQASCLFIMNIGMFKQWDIITTLTRAQEFASKIVEIHGATTTDQSFYQSLIQQM